MSDGSLIWITGLAGCGKSTLAEKLILELNSQGLKPVLVDGDVIRELFGNDLGHTMEDRFKNAYRIAKLCHWLTEQGLIVICATVSLFHEIHDYNRKMNKNYYEILLKTDISVLISRNKKDLYSEDSKDVMGKDQMAEFPKNPTYTGRSHNHEDLQKNMQYILNLIDIS